MTQDLTFRELPANSAGRRLHCDQGCGRIGEWEAIPTSELARHLSGTMLLCGPHKAEAEEE